MKKIMKKNGAKIGKKKQPSSAFGSSNGLVRMNEGVLNPRVFVDPELYKLEQERIFGKTWLFVAHESEVPKPGDFVTRKMGEDPVVVWKGQDSKVRVFLNVCRHRGRKVCGEDLGCAAQFRCPYHGWTYSNKGELIAVPFFEGYQGKLDKGELGLYEAPAVESYGGMVFASWEKGGGNLGEYLGEMKWVMDLMFQRTDGVEVVGPPMRWEVDANWKLGAANFAGDGTHIFSTHGFRTALGLETIGGIRDSFLLPTKKGHCTVLTSWPKGLEYNRYLALPKEIWPELESHLTPGQLELLGPMQIIVGNLFPNMSFLNTASHTSEESGDSGGHQVSFLTVRLWQPKGADKMEVWSWHLVDRNSPDWWKEASRECYQRAFGMAGWFEQDDMENWGEVTRALQSPAAKKIWLQYKLGMDLTRANEWPGEGVAYVQKPTFLDLNERNFYTRWGSLVGRPE